MPFFYLKMADQDALEQEVPGKFRFLARQKNSILMKYEEETLLAGKGADHYPTIPRQAPSPGS